MAPSKRTLLLDWKSTGNECESSFPNSDLCLLIKPLKHFSCCDTTGAYLTMETSLAIDTLPKGYDHGSSGGNAQLLGIWGVAAFLGSAIGPMTGGPLLYLFGSTGTAEDQDYTIRGYAILLSLSSAYFILSAISLKWVEKKDV